MRGSRGLEEVLKQWATKFDAVKEGGREGECAVASVEVGGLLWLEAGG